MRGRGVVRMCMLLGWGRAQHRPRLSPPPPPPPPPPPTPLFASIGRMVWRDVGPTAVGFRLLMKVCAAKAEGVGHS